MDHEGAVRPVAKPFAAPPGPAPLRQFEGSLFHVPLATGCRGVATSLATPIAEAVTSLVVVVSVQHLSGRDVGKGWGIESRPGPM